MSYHIYTTKSLILSERPWRESDRVYSILTRDLGKVFTTAIGVRKINSKIRGALEPLTLTTVSLVMGKEYWRVTSAEVIRNLPLSPFIAHPMSLLEKLVQGEAAQPELFDVVEEAFSTSRHYDESFEIQLVSRIMHQLGYLKGSDLSLSKAALIKAINQGLEVSHL